MMGGFCGENMPNDGGAASPRPVRPVAPCDGAVRMPLPGVSRREGDGAGRWARRGGIRRCAPHSLKRLGILPGGMGVVSGTGRKGAASAEARSAHERAYMEETQRKTLVCSLSGGVDSAASAVVAQGAAPGRAFALLLPCSSEEELKGERGKDIVDAQRAADFLGMPREVLNLSDLWRAAVSLFEAHARHLAQTYGIPLDEGKLAWAINNLKPTLRMMAGGFFADAFEGLTIGTDNAIENFLGYFSIRGDGIADRQPIRDCTKAEVRSMLQAAGFPVDLVGRTPTAGLWPGQTDEDELGFTYDQADALFVWLLERHVQEPVMDATLTVMEGAVERLLARPDLPVPERVARSIIAQNRRTRFKRKSDDLAALLERRGLTAPRM